MIFNKYYGRKALGLLSVLLLNIGGATLAHAETLSDAVVAALNNHPSVEAAMANRDVYIEERKEQVSGYFPRLNASAAAGRIYGDNSTTRGLTVTRGSAYSGYGEGSVSLTQPLFDGFEVSNKVDAAQARRNSANYNIVDIREDLALRTVMSYLGIMRGRESLEKIDAHLAQIQSYRGRLENMVTEGAADESQAVLAHDIQIQLEKTRVDVAAQMRSAMVEYRALTGSAMAGDMILPVPRADMIGDDVEYAVKWATARHPALVAASLSEEAVSYEVDVERAAYYPDLTGELSYLKSDKKEVLGGEVEDAKALLRMNWSFETGGATSARISKKRQRLKQKKAQFRELSRQIERDVRTAFSDMEKLARQKRILTERKNIQTQLLSNYEAQFEGALVTLLQMLRAHNSLFTADLALLNVEYSHLASRYAALASMGRLQESLNVVSAARNE